MFIEICYYRTCHEQWMEETRASFKQALNTGTRLKCWDPQTPLWFWFHFESSIEKDLFSQL